MAELRTIMSIPPEIHLIITKKLSFPDNINLKVTNRYFYNLIKQPSHQELLEAESSQYALHHGLFASMDCVRLLPAVKFADTMRTKKKRKGGLESHRRFCVRCGMNPKPMTGRYSPGSRIVTHGNVQVICIRCRKLKKGVADGTVNHCEDCWNRVKHGQTEQRTREERRRLTSAKIRDLDSIIEHDGYNTGDEVNWPDFC